MELAYVERFERRVMSREEFDRLPEKVRAEYVDGVALMSPPAAGGHQDVALNVAIALRQALPHAVVRCEAGFALPSGTLRIPDVTVQRVRDDEHWSEQVPVVAVEILSSSTRGEDLFRKTDDYRRAGIDQYWIVDRALRTVTVLVNAGEQWDIAITLTDEEPVASIDVADLGRVDLDLAELLD